MAAPTTILDRKTPRAADEAGFHLLVMGPELFATHALPARGEVIIGRASDVGVNLEDGLVSRRHARLRIGATFEIEDLGSANGTRLREARLPVNAPARVHPGEAIAIGSTILMVQPNRPQPQAARRRPLPHPEFGSRVEWECARAEATGGVFTVLRFTEDMLDESVLRPMDVVGLYAPGEYEALLPGLDAGATKALGRKLGIASYPIDGRHAGALLARAGARLRRQADQDDDAPVVADQQMRRLHALAERAAAGTINVLIVGETGVGKEVLARTVHRLSPRAARPFVCVDCAALSDALLESELFGHERGAFTGAGQAKPGLLETAPGGTMFLDEIGELPLKLQAKLLRAIEAREVVRVGGLRPRKIDVRFVAATNRDLEAAVGAGTFRRDLYFRLNGMTLAIPALRERPTEIAPLARAFVRELGGRKAPVLSDEAVAALEAHAWPGNVRELRNAIERALLLVTGSTIGPEHLDGLSCPSGIAAAGSERERIVAALAACAGNQSRAAKMLGISRKVLIARLDQYGVARPRPPRKDQRR